MHTTHSRELTAQAESEAEAIEAVQDQLQPGERVNMTWIEPRELEPE